MQCLGTKLQSESVLRCYKLLEVLICEAVHQATVYVGTARNVLGFIILHPMIRRAHVERHRAITELHIFEETQIYGGPEALAETKYALKRR